MQQVTLGPRDPQMGVRIVQALGFHKMEIRLWDAVGSMQQVTLGPRDPQMGVRVVQALGFHKMEIRPSDAAV